MFQNYPNPFNPSTRINYSVPYNSFIKIKLYDIFGNEVATLINEKKPAGNYSISYNGSGLSSGIYFYQLSADNFTEVKKMILLR